MNYRDTNREWNEKGATLSDKSAREEFDLTEKEIISAINEGKLQYRENNIYGNPYLRLLRVEVEKLVEEKHGTDFLREKNARNEIKKLEKELRVLKSKISTIEDRRNELLNKDCS